MQKSLSESAFQVAVAKTLSWEKARLVNDQEDPGGLTRYGISQRAYPHLDIKNLTKEDAIRIYRSDYWQAPGIDQVADVYPELAIRLFDLGVNCGQRTAVKFLQRAANTVCTGEVPAHRAAAWRRKVARLIGGKPLIVDGIIGPNTLGVLRACPYPNALLSALKGEAYCHYKKGKPLQRAGWLNRLES